MPRANGGQRTMTRHADRSARSMGAFWLIVPLVACAANAMSLASTPLWIYPDSVDYIQLAGTIVDDGNWSHELFLIRPPGYPLLLAVLFRWFGPASPVVLQVVQHAMNVAIAMLASAMAWHVSRNRWIALLTGVGAAASLQVLAYANLVLTETSYLLCFTACAFALARAVGDRRLRWLVLASLLAGVGWLFKPVAVCLAGGCGLAGAWLALLGRATRVSTATGAGQERSTTFTRIAWPALAAVVPVALVTLPWHLHGMRLHQANGTNRTLDYVLYLRAVTFDGLDAPDSAALNDIKNVVEQAKTAGILAGGATHRDRGTVMKAYERLRGVGFAECSAIMGDAGRDVMKEHPRAIAMNTLRYAAWMILQPDPVYRFLPGGAPGADGKRAMDADIYESSTYLSGPGSWEPLLRRYEQHLPLSREARSLTAMWTAMVTWFHNNVDRPPGLLGVGGSRFADLAILGVIGLGCGVLRRGAAAWRILVVLVGAHILVSAFLGAAQTRYVVVVKPLLILGAVDVSVRVAGWARAMAWHGLVRLRGFAAEPMVDSASR